MSTRKRACIQVLIVDDHPLIRHGIKTMLQEDRGIEIVAEAGTMTEAFHAMDRLQHAVALMDVHLPDGNTITAFPDYRSRYPHIKTIFFTAYFDDAMARRAIGLGASGYLVKSVRGHDLIRAVRKVAAGQTLRRAEFMAIGWEFEGLGPPAVARLSPQAYRILALVSEGLTNREIGERLSLSDRTVRNYLYRIYRRWNVKGRTHAASIFLRRVAGRASEPSLQDSNLFRRRSRHHRGT